MTQQWRRNLLKSIGGIGIAISCGFIATAQRRPIRPTTRPTETKPSTTSKPKLAYLESAFDSSVGKLSVPFLGHDLRAVLRELEARKKRSEKGEFETTQAYTQRLE